MARQDRVSIMLETEIKERFQYYATSMGLTNSALGAFLLGQWVFAQDRVNGPMMEAMKDLMTKAVSEQMQSMTDLVAGGELGKQGEGDPAHVEQGGTSPTKPSMNEEIAMLRHNDVKDFIQPLRG